jgi:hypothetical protein
VVAAVFPSGAFGVLLAWRRLSKPKPHTAKGAWGTQMAVRPGANRTNSRGEVVAAEWRVAQLFQREPVS